MSKTPAGINADIDRALEELNRLHTGLNIVVAEMVARMTGTPRAASYDRPVVSGSSAHLWCFRCESDRCNHDKVPVSGPSDPVGEAAICKDQARSDLRDLGMDARNLLRIVERWYHLNSRYKPRGDQLASAKEQLLAELDHWPDCESCARAEERRGVPRREGARQRGKLTFTIDGKETKAHVCRWCQDFIRDLERWPTVAEVDAHHRGKRIMRPAS